MCMYFEQRDSDWVKGTSRFTPIFAVFYSVFEDKEVELDHNYTYLVTPVVGDTMGVQSPPFTYRHSTAFCGNKQLDGYVRLIIQQA